MLASTNFCGSGVSTKNCPHIFFFYPGSKTVHVLVSHLNPTEQYSSKHCQRKERQPKETPLEFHQMYK